MCNKKQIIYENTFDSCEDIAQFYKNGAGSIEIINGRLYLDDTQFGEGLTCWLNRVFEGDIHITYRAMVVEPELASNINVFFMASPIEGDMLSWTGSYAEYHKKARMYIETYTGEFSNINGKSNSGYSRARKDPGFILISENRTVKSEINVEYFFEIIKKGNQITLKTNGETVHSFTDNTPYNSGVMGFRTYMTRLWFDDLRIYAI